MRPNRRYPPPTALQVRDPCVETLVNVHLARNVDIRAKEEFACLETDICRNRPRSASRAGTRAFLRSYPLLSVSSAFSHLPDCILEIQLRDRNGKVTIANAPDQHQRFALLIPALVKNKVVRG